MPKYYCDYCDTFLTHDSPSVRKTHNGGRKHKENVRLYYQTWMEQQAQKLVDATARAFKEGKILSNPLSNMVRPGGGAMIPPPPTLQGPPRPGMPPMPYPYPLGMPGMPPMMPGMPRPPMPGMPMM
uniref:U1 small nuclear ribonucleoprotein C n=1 Tax=Plectus sambesii TaxID=2011161 RepID=A0A914VJQ0_9BILA